MTPKTVLVPLLSLAVAATAWITPAIAQEAPEAPPAQVTPAPAVLAAADEVDVPEAPIMLGVTPVMAPSGAKTAVAPPLSFPLAAGLTYGMPMVVGGIGYGLMGIADRFGAPFGVLSTLSLVTVLGSMAAYSAGYVYAGEPGRGAWVLLGEYGVLFGSTLVAAGVAVLIAGAGQSAGFALPLVAIPVVGGSWVAYQVWKMNDLKALIEAKNAAARRP